MSLEFHKDAHLLQVPQRLCGVWVWTPVSHNTPYMAALLVAITVVLPFTVDKTGIKCFNV